MEAKGGLVLWEFRGLRLGIWGGGRGGEGFPGLRVLGLGVQGLRV